MSRQLTDLLTSLLNKTPNKLDITKKHKNNSFKVILIYK